MVRRPEVEALTRSFRSRVLLLVLVVAGGLAAALWSGTRETGIGEPEDRRRIMVVTSDTTSPSNYAVLARAGFEIEVDDLAGWLDRARAEAPESEAEGVARLLELADLRGVALVVLEREVELDLSEVELEPSLASIEGLDERDYRVLSAGDFGFPHHLSVDEPGEDPRLRVPGYGALEAVFRQPLIGAREDPERPTVEELQFEAATALGRQMVERPAGFTAVIEQTRRSIELALDDDSGAVSLVPTLTTGTAMPTPDGGVLLFHHPIEIYSDNARTLELDPGSAMELSWLGPDALARGLESGVFETTACTSLAGGVLALGDLHIEAAIDGSAIALGSEIGTMLWHKQGPGCDWAPVAELDARGSLVLAPNSGVVGSRSLAAQVDAGEVRIWTLPPPLPDANTKDPNTNDPGEGGLISASVLLDQAERRFTSVAFLDERHLVVGSDRLDEDRKPTDDRIYLLDRDRPGVHLSVPVGFFAEGRHLREVLGITGAHDTVGPELLVVAFNRQGRVELIRLRIGASAWAAFLAAERPSTPEFGVEGRLVSLAPAELEAEIIAEADKLHGLSVGPTTLLYAPADGLEPSDLVIYSLATGERRQLTTNEIRDYLPRLASDGSYATFVSRMQVSISITPFSVPRMIALPTAN